MDEFVWVVEQGEYSDYRVVGVFSSEANAMLVARAINSMEHNFSEATVAMWPMDPAVEALNQGMKVFYVTMLRDGTVERCATGEMSSYEIGGSISIWRRSQATAYRGTGAPDALTATIWATDEKHAIKITNERRIQMIAQNEWD